MCGKLCMFFPHIPVKHKLFLTVTELVFLRATERFGSTGLFSLYAHSHKD